MNSSKKVLSIIKTIKSQYDNPNFNVSALALCNEVSTSYIRELINYKYGICPQQLIEKLRLKRAKELLMDTDLKIYEISKKVGYCNIKTFRIAFKKQYKKTPSEFRTQ
jgi:two-component system response regulator YesN